MQQLYTYQRGSQTITLAKSLAFPDALSLGDLFEEMKPYVIGDPGKRRPDRMPPVRAGGLEIGPFCSMSRVDAHLRDDGIGLDVKPTAQVVKWLTENMGVPGSVYFEITQRADGYLVTVNYNHIIGSRYLALLPLFSTHFPKMKEAQRA